MSTQANPTAVINLDFSAYLNQRKDELSHREERGVPTYSFALDRQLRQRLTSLKPLRSAVQMYVSFQTTFFAQQMYSGMGYLAVSPQQYGDIYELGEQCARRLGIAIPQIIVVTMDGMYAATMASDDKAPLIILSSKLVDSLTPDELLFVIGHECGHIHNLHGVYNTLVQLISNPVAEYAIGKISSGREASVKQLAAFVIKSGLEIFLMNWSRSAEITCDRAGLICVGDLNAAQLAFLKIVTGGSVRAEQINIDAYVQQLEQMNALTRVSELFHSHPLIPRRIQALQAFAECEKYYEWIEQAPPASITVHPLIETDRYCQKIISVTGK